MQNSHQALLKEALSWLEEDATRRFHDNLFEKIERTAAGDERPVPEAPLTALRNLITRITDSLPHLSDHTEPCPGCETENQRDSFIGCDEHGTPIASMYCEFFHCTECETNYRVYPYRQ